MSVALVTGAAGLIGGRVGPFFADEGFDVVGIDNDMRRVLLRRGGVHPVASPELEPDGQELPSISTPTSATRAPWTRSSSATARISPSVIHTAAQPSHDWAAREPVTDFTVNANGTLHAARGDAASLPRGGVHLHAAPTRSMATRPTGCRWSSSETRWEIEPGHAFARTASTRRCRSTRRKH